MFAPNEFVFVASAFCEVQHRLKTRRPLSVIFRGSVLLLVGNICFVLEILVLSGLKM